MPFNALKIKGLEKRGWHWMAFEGGGVVPRWSHEPCIVGNSMDSFSLEYFDVYAPEW